MATPPSPIVSSLPSSHGAAACAIVHLRRLGRGHLRFPAPRILGRRLPRPRRGSPHARRALLRRVPTRSQRVPPFAWVPSPKAPSPRSHGGGPALSGLGPSSRPSRVPRLLAHSGPWARGARCFVLPLVVLVARRFACSQQPSSFLQHSSSFLQHSLSFLQHSLSFLQHSLSFLQHLLTWVLYARAAVLTGV